MQEAYDALPDAVFGVGPDGRITLVNRAGEALLGAVEGEPAGVHLPGLAEGRATLRARRAGGGEVLVEASASRHGDLLLAVARPAEDAPGVERRLNAALDTSAQAIAVTDEDGVITYANPAVARVFGHDRDALRGTPIDALVTGAREAGERVARRADGTAFPVDVSVTVVETDAGRRTLHAMRDVTERAHTAAYLEREARRRDLVVELGQEALVLRHENALFDRALRAVSDALELEMVGVSELSADGRELILRRSYGWGLDPGAAPRMPVAGTQSGWTLAHGTTVIADLASETRFPTERLAEFGVVSGIAVPLRIEGAEVGVLSAFGLTHRDFAEEDRQFMGFVANLLATALARRRTEMALEESNRRLQAVLEHAPMAVYLKDLEGRYLIANAATARVARLTVEEVLGRTDEELLPPEYAATMTNHDRLVIAAGEPLRFTERVERPEGEEVYSSVKFPLRDEAGRVFGVGGLSMDVTEQMRVESERARLEERVSRSERLESVGQLAGGIAHDFNNLLAVIANYANFLVEAMPPDGQPHDDARQIVAATERAADLTRRLLQFSRRQPSHPEVLDTGAIVGAIEPMMRRTLGEHIAVAADYGDGLWQVVADRGQLEQVLMNLALNARDAMPAGGALTISVANETAPPAALDGAFVRLTVADTGEGMAPEVAKRALEPFFTTKPAGEGTGLGLSSVYGIVVQAGGSLELDSAPGEGTRVTVWLPATSELPLPARDGATAPPGGAGERVLVVEDQASVREVTRRILSDHGYEVACVEDPSEAERVVLADGAPDVLVTDVLMPGMSGADLVDRLRAALPSLPVVFVSGFAEEPPRNAPGGAPTLFVEKPFRAAELLDAVARALR